jgi:hypothetical protein
MVVSSGHAIAATCGVGTSKGAVFSRSHSSALPESLGETLSHTSWWYMLIHSISFAERIYKSHAQDRHACPSSQATTHAGHHTHTHTHTHTHIHMLAIAVDQRHVGMLPGSPPGTTSCAAMGTS